MSTKNTTSDSLSVSPAQLAAARALLGWSQAELALRAGVARTTLADFERGARVPVLQNRLALERTLTAVGIAFISESGVAGFSRMGVILSLPTPGDDKTTDHVELKGNYRG